MAKARMALNMYTIALLVVILIIVFAFFGYRSYEERRVVTKEDIYLSYNVLKVAKRFYLFPALDDSVHQAMYDNGKNGGFVKMGKTGNELRLEVLENDKCSKMDKGKRIGKLGETLGCKPGEYNCDTSIGDKDYVNKGYQVGLLQLVLTELGYDTKEIDCIFGGNTFNALLSFQKANGLVESGATGIATIEKLKRDFFSKWDNCEDFFVECDEIYWYRTARGVYPTKDDLVENLKSATAKNMKLYTRDKYILMEKEVTLPSYDEGISVEIQNNEIKVIAKGNKNLVFYEMKEKELERETTKLQLDSTLENTYKTEYFSLYEKAKDIFNNLEGKDCKNIKAGDVLLAKDGERVVVIKKTDTPKCEAAVKVNVVGSENLTIYNGTDISYEPLNMIFMTRLS
jgi:hypothetical protein